MAINPLQSHRPVIVYIDFKSPYAYLAIGPTRALERELGIQFDWRPFVLDIPSYLGSARLDKTGKVAEQNRSAEQWSGVKYAYFDCRRYASLEGMTIRGTTKIWDTNLVATAMLWVREQHENALHPFIDAVYTPFWKRELDLEDERLVAGLLDDLDADGEGFLTWAQAEGLAQNAHLQSEAFAAGIYGVPTYAVADELFFGREHLPQVRWHLAGRQGPCPDIAYTLPKDLPQQPAPPQRITIGVDESLDSLLAIPRLKVLLDRSGVAADWVKIAPRKPARLPPAEDRSRSATHKRLRVQNRLSDHRRYAPDALAPDQYQSAIAALLDRLRISLQTDGPEQVVKPAMPGIAVLLEEELFIGRQHLQLIGARLAL